MSEPIIEANSLSRRFGETVALDNVDICVDPGCVHGLVGVNGAGKTTFIRHILGLLKAKSGSIRAFGLAPVGHPVEVLRKIGYLSEERDLPEWMRIDELMQYTRAFHPNWDTEYADELLQTFGLDASQKVQSLSKGMRAQAGLISAVAHRPELLLLDEPSSGLDPVVRLDILDAMVRTVVDDGRTVLFSSHLLDEVERMSDCVTMIDHGRVVLDGDLDEIKEHHHLLDFNLTESLSTPPVLEGALSIEGGGRRWTVLCGNAIEQVREELNRIGAEIVNLRNATLQEIFVSRVGRKNLTLEEV